MSDETPDAEGIEDFDEFWAKRARKRRKLRIFGEVVELPPSLPLQFEMEARKLQRSKREEDVKKLVGILFGDDALARWAGKGLDMEQFSVLLAWAPQAISGATVTLAEVADQIAGADAQESADPS